MPTVTESTQSEEQVRGLVVTLLQRDKEEQVLVGMVRADIHSALIMELAAVAAVDIKVGVEVFIPLLAAVVQVMFQSDSLQ
jgi:hypothetical protein